MTPEPQENPAISTVMGRNIRTIQELRAKAAKERTTSERIADWITSFSGSLRFLYIQCGLFGAWLLANSGVFGNPPFDHYPFPLLTFIVTLEAILLSTLLLIKQNRLTSEVEERADLDLHIGLLTEHELTRVLDMLEQIQKRLGVQSPHTEELAELKKETKPEEVLAEIARVQISAERRLELEGADE